MWSMTGPNLFIMTLMSVFTNLDRMMGEHFMVSDAVLAFNRLGLQV